MGNGFISGLLADIPHCSDLISILHEWKPNTALSMVQ